MLLDFLTACLTYLRKNVFPQKGQFANFWTKTLLYKNSSNYKNSPFQDIFRYCFSFQNYAKRCYLKICWCLMDVDVDVDMDTGTWHGHDCGYSALNQELLFKYLEVRLVKSLIQYPT